MSDPAPTTRIAVLLFTDIVDSVDMQQRLGTEAYSAILQQHDRLFREALEPIPNSRLYQDTGDGQLAQFETAAAGVEAALRFQMLLEQAQWSQEKPSVRVGLHQGQVTEIQTADDSPGKAVGMPINIAARVMGLAQGGQILLTRAIFDDARQFVREHPKVKDVSDLPAIEWKAHGNYRFKGAEDPMEVFEVGAVGLAPLSAPGDSEKAWRSISPEEEATLGWRPGSGLEIPHRKDWILEKPLGAGGFGEVWLAKHRKLKDQRVFKFCFDVDRLRSFKREVTLFRLIKEALGDRPDITPIHEIHLESSPYFLELDYVAGGDLNDWAEEKGGIAEVPLTDRLEMVAKVAETLAAAHSVGIIHKDIKPSNILIQENADGSVQPQVMDFGIGFLSDATKLNELGITQAGFTETIFNANDSSRTGTRLYAPPEILVGKPHTIQGDIYALGVFLYQMAIGDLTRPLATGWQRDVDDELLIQDIEACVVGDPGERLGDAGEVADRIRSLETRTRELAERREAERKAAIRQRLVKLSIAASVILIAFSTLLVVGYFREKNLRQDEEQARIEEAKQRKRAETELAKANAVVKFVNEMLSSIDPDIAKGMDRKLLKLILDSGAEKLSKLEDQPEVQGTLSHTIGRAYLSIGMLQEAEQHLQDSLRLIRSTRGDDHVATLEAKNSLGGLHWSLGNYEESERLLTEAMEQRRRVLGTNHLDTLRSQYNLALVYRSQGHHHEATTLFAQTLDTSRSALGEEDPFSMMAMSGLLLAYKAQGKYKQSLPLLRNLLEMKMRILGEDHTSTLGTKLNLGVIYKNLQDHTNAQIHFEQGLETSLRILGEEHPTTISLMNNLGVAYLGLRKRNKARDLFAQCLDMKKRVLGEEHPDTLRTLNNLAAVTQGIGDLKTAEILCKQALESRKRTVGEEHPDTARSLGLLASIYKDAKRLKEAEPLYARTVELQKRLLGEDHQHTLKSTFDHLTCLFSLKKYEQAKIVATDSFLAHQRVYGEKHSGTHTSKQYLARLLILKGSYKEAGKLLKEIVELRTGIYGPGHLLTLSTLLYQASVEEVQGNATIAQELASQGFKAASEELGPDHPITARFEEIIGRSKP